MKRHVGVYTLVAAGMITGLSVACGKNRLATSLPASVSAGSATPVPVATSAAVAPRFRDVAAAAGLNYEWRIAGKRPLNIRQTIGNGCAFLDYDGDGNQDILLVGPTVALYNGDGKGHFRDVSDATGVSTLRGGFIGAAVGDYNGDGFNDLYLSAYRGGALLQNNGGKSFKNVTASAGIAPQPWGTSCAFADFDGDGRTDIYIGNYVDFGPKTEPQMCRFGEVLGSCGPRYYEPLRGVLYRNRGAGKFTDVTKAWGAGEVAGKCLGVAIADYDGSGRLSMALANDEMPGDLLQNTGKSPGRFENVALQAGTAHDSAGSVHGGMGIDWGDYDNDGLLDKVVATFSNEAKNIYHNDGDGMFTDRAAMLGVAAPMMPFVAFGVKFADFDNDGYLDLIFANGHVQDTIDKVDGSLTYRQPMMMMHNIGGKNFVPLSPQEAGPDFGRPLVGRGLAVGDYDNDGKIDALVVDSEGKPLLLHNETPEARHWLKLHLRSASGGDAAGAKVELNFDGKKRVGFCGTDGSYLSASDARVHFGLGGYSGQVKVTVLWPGGTRQELNVAATDRIVEIKQDK